MSKIGRNDLCPCGSGDKYKKCCGAPISQSSSELKQHLKESLEFLIKSCVFYDEGDVAEAKRISLEIRKLVHDTKLSKSILNSLRLKNMRFLDTGFPYLKENLMPHLGLVIMQIGGNRELSKYLPLLDEFENSIKKDFDSWWNSIVISDQEKNVFTRENLVLCIANQDGGAHVDEDIEKQYYGLTRNNTVGWKIITPSGEEDLKEVHLATVRQIGHEVILTLLEELPDFVNNHYVINYFKSTNLNKSIE